MSVRITTYNISEDDHVLTPSLTMVQDNIMCEYKEDTDMLHPTLILSNNVDQDFNYVYIHNFNRFYFFKGREFSQQYYNISLDVDPLRSWKAQIKSLDVIANRSSSRFNVYQADPMLPFLQKNIIATQKFPQGFNANSMILAVNGG